MANNEQVELISSSDYNSLKHQPTAESVNGKQESLSNQKSLNAQKHVWMKEFLGVTTAVRAVVVKPTTHGQWSDRIRHRIRAENDPRFSMSKESEVLSH